MSLNPIAFWFLRHGETDWNAQGLSQGNTDIALNAVGRAQAARAARSLVGLRFASIVASPLSRARDTAQTVAAALGMDFTLDSDLREVGFGEQEGFEGSNEPTMADHAPASDGVPASGEDENF